MPCVHINTKQQVVTRPIAARFASRDAVALTNKRIGNTKVCNLKGLCRAVRSMAMCSARVRSYPSEGTVSLKCAWKCTNKEIVAHTAILASCVPSDRLLIAPGVICGGSAQTTGIREGTGLGDAVDAITSMHSWWLSCNTLDLKDNCGPHPVSERLSYS